MSAATTSSKGVLLWLRIAGWIALSAAGGGLVRAALLACKNGAGGGLWWAACVSLYGASVMLMLAAGWAAALFDGASPTAVAVVAGIFYGLSATVGALVYGAGLSAQGQGQVAVRDLAAVLPAVALGYVGAWWSRWRERTRTPAAQAPP
jgi:hypothetical protein